MTSLYIVHDIVVMPKNQPIGNLMKAATHMCAPFFAHKLGKIFDPTLVATALDVQDLGIFFDNFEATTSFNIIP